MILYIDACSNIINKTDYKDHPSLDSLNKVYWLLGGKYSGKKSKSIPTLTKEKRKVINHTLDTYLEEQYKK